MIRTSSRWIVGIGLVGMLGASCVAKEKLINAPNRGGPNATNVSLANKMADDTPMTAMSSDQLARGDQGGDTLTPFEATPATAYVAKVKNLLTGLGPTSEELDQVSQSPNALAELIDRWMAQPEYQAKALAFYRDAFQQNQVTLGMLFEAQNMTFNMNGTYQAMLERNIMESFPRTVWQLVAERRPFNETVTTERYMMTAPLMAMIAFMDTYQVADNGARTDLAIRQWPDFHYQLDHAVAEILTIIKQARSSQT